MDRSRLLNMWPQDLLRLLVGAGSTPTSTHQLLRSLLAAEREFWLVAIGAMVADVHLTAQGLQLGLQEMNPVARQAIEEAGLFGLYGLKTGALFVALSLRPLVPDRYGVIVPIALAIPSVIAVGINTAMLVWVLL